ncbi:MAG: SPASM domain-containing protein [Magnetococcales bacterium]|nr:SPASM domain-containing protein [Magnetococcales bacterium]
MIRNYHIYTYNGVTVLLNVDMMSATLVTDDEISVLSEHRGRIAPKNKAGYDVLTHLGLLKSNIDSKVYVEEKDDFTATHVALFLTQQCNLNCSYCIGGPGGEYGAKSRMTQSTAQKSIDWVIKNSTNEKTIGISFFGGEPLLNFDVLKFVISYCKSQGSIHHKTFEFHITTNGTICNEDVLNTIRANDISISISFDGPESVQNNFRPFKNGSGSYDIVIKNIALFKKHTNSLVGHAVLSLDIDPTSVYDEMKGAGFRRISMTPVSASMFSTSNTHESSQQNRNIFKFIEDEAQKWVAYAANKERTFLAELKDSSRLYTPLSLLHQNIRRSDTCGAGKHIAAISSNGDIYLCHRFVGINHYKVGNINTDNVFPVDFDPTPVNRVDGCNSCFAKHYCAGGCAYENFVSHGTVYKPNHSYCKIRMRELELAGYVYANFNHEDIDFLTSVGVLPAVPCYMDF